MDILFILAGLPALLFGGDLLVRGAVSLAQVLRVSPIVISLTLVGFGTSTPELVASVSAALKGAPGLALGNVVGSNIANILLILGAAAVISPMVTRNLVSRTDTVWFVVTAVLGAGLAAFGVIPRGAGLALMALLAVYIWQTLRNGDAPEAPVDVVAPSVRRSGITFLAGLALTLGGAVALVDGATGIARTFGVPETVIGLTLVAVGTSLPELATSLIAAWRGRSEVAIGNILGSGIFNVLAILGTTAAIAPLRVPAGEMVTDGLVMLAASLVLAAMLLRSITISRLAGVAALAVYIGYLALLSQTL